MGRWLRLCLALACLLTALPRRAVAQMDAHTRPALARIGAAVIAARAQHADPRAIEKRWGGMLPHDAGPLLADTLDGRVLLACRGGSLNQLGIALVNAGRVTLSRAAPEHLELSDDWTEPLSVQQVFLVRPSGVHAGGKEQWCALFWCNDQGTAAPQRLRAMPLGPLPAMASIAVVTNIARGGKYVGVFGEGSHCEIRSRRGEVTWRTSELNIEMDPDTHFQWKRGDPVPVEIIDWRLVSTKPFRARALSTRHTTQPAPGP